MNKMNPKEMTGLQLLEAMCTGKIPPASISETIPMQPFEVSEGKSLDVSLDSAFKYYCIYKGVERPDASKLQTLKTFKTAI
jgi:hypothetical protein